MGPLTAATRGVYDGGLGRATVNDEGATAACGSVCKREPNQIQILTEAVAVAQGVGARGGSALSQDDNEAGQSDGESQSNIVPGHVGQAQLGKAARNSPNNPNTSILPMEVTAGHNHSDHGEQCAREAWSEDFEANYDGQYRQCDEQARPMRFRRVLKGKKELPDESMPGLFDTEHLVNFAESDLNADA